ncbi:MAG: hypothetical protein WC807_15070 [Hyphomicrobium sp.]
MDVKFSRRIVPALAIASLLLGGCAHSYQPEPAGYGEPLRSGIEDRGNRLAGRISEFCADYEWVCIVGGLLAFGGTVAAIKNSGND